MADLINLYGNKNQQEDSSEQQEEEKAASPQEKNQEYFTQIQDFVSKSDISDGTFITIMFHPDKGYYIVPNREGEELQVLIGHLDISKNLLINSMAVE